MAKKNTAPTESQEIIELPVEELVIPENELSPNLVTDADTVKQRGAAIAVKYSAATIADLTSAEAVEEMSKDLRSLVKIRTSLDKRRLSVNRFTNDMAKLIGSWFEPTEKKLSGILADYKKREDARLEEERQKREAIVNSRIKELEALGAMFGGSMYQIGTAMATRSQIADDAGWPVILQEFTIAAEQKKAEAAAAAERLKAAEEKALLSDRKDTLLEMGAVARWENEDGEVVTKDAPGAGFVVRLGDAVAGRQDLLECWDEVLAEFQEEVATRERLATEERERQSRLDAIEAARVVPQAEPPFTINTPSGKVVEVQRDLLAVEVPAERSAPPREVERVTPAVGTSPAVAETPQSRAKFVPLPPMYEDETRMYLSGAMDALKRAKAAFPDLAFSPIFNEMRDLYNL